MMRKCGKVSNDPKPSYRQDLRHEPWHMPRHQERQDRNIEEVTGTR